VVTNENGRFDAPHVWLLGNLSLRRLYNDLTVVRRTWFDGLILWLSFYRLGGFSCLV